MPQLTGLAPVGSDAPSVLILGSFPGVESLRRQQYYAGPGNRFWPLMGEIYAVESMLELAYEARIAELAVKGIRLWDVVAACDRSGSSDNRIRNTEYNDVLQMLDDLQTIHTIILNGKTAEKHFFEYTKRQRGKKHRLVSIVRCLSTSAANKRYGADPVLLKNWRSHLSQ